MKIKAGVLIVAMGVLLPFLANQACAGAAAELRSSSSPSPSPSPSVKAARSGVTTDAHQPSSNGSH